MGGQIVDATLVAAPKQRNTAAEKDAIKAGKTAGEIWPDQPAKAAQKDTDARWTLKFAKARPTAGRQAGDRHRHPELRLQEQHRDLPGASASSASGKVTDGARFDGRMLRDVVTQRQYRLRRLGRHRLSQPGQRGMAQVGRAGSAASIARSPGASRCRSDRAGQRRQVHGPRPRRACVRPAEGQDGAVHPHHRHQARRGQDHARQSRLQHEPPDLPRTTGSHGIAAPKEQENHRKSAQTAPILAIKGGSSHSHRDSAVQCPQIRR